MNEQQIIKKFEFLVKRFDRASRPLDVVIGIIQLMGLMMDDLGSNDEKSRIGMLSDQSTTVIKRLDAMQTRFNFSVGKIDILRRLFGNGMSDHLMPEIVKLSEELSKLIPNVEIARSLLAYAGDASKGFIPSHVNSMAEEFSLLIRDLIEPDVSDRILSVGDDSLTLLQFDLQGRAASLSWDITSEVRLAEDILKVAGIGVDVHNIHYLGEDMQYFDNQGKFTKVIVNPPWARLEREVEIPLPVRATSAISLFVQYGLEAAQKSVLAIVPAGFLFRTAGLDQELKRWLVEQGYVRAVIKLPNKLMSWASSPNNLLLLDKTQKHESVIFLDASNEEVSERGLGSKEPQSFHLKVLQLLKKCDNENTCRIVTCEEIRENSYNLDVARYCVAYEAKKFEAFFEGKKTARLDEVVDIIRAQATGPSKGGDIKIEELNPSNVGRDGYLGGAPRIVNVDGALLGRIQRQKILSGDVVLAIKGSIGKVGLFPDEPDSRDFYAGQSFVILRLKKESPIFDPVVLYSYLSCSPVQALIDSKAAGVTVRSIKMDDLRSLPLVIEEKKVQEKVIESHSEMRNLFAQIDRIMKKINRLKDEAWGIEENE